MHDATTSLASGLRAVATAELPQVDACCTLTWRRQLPVSCETVFAALTEPSQLEGWMEGRVRVELRPGGRFSVDFGREGMIDGVVTELVRPERFSYCWGSSIVRASVVPLAPDASSSELSFAHHGLAVDLAAGIGAGWEGFLDQLCDHLEGRELDPARQRAEHHAHLVRLYQRYLTDSLGR